MDLSGARYAKLAKQTLAGCGTVTAGKGLEAAFCGRAVLATVF
jgi:hypothetical protein